MAAEEFSELRAETIDHIENAESTGEVNVELDYEEEPNAFALVTRLEKNEHVSVNRYWIPGIDRQEFEEVYSDWVSELEDAKDAGYNSF